MERICDTDSGSLSYAGWPLTIFTSVIDSKVTKGRCQPAHCSNALAFSKVGFEVSSNASSSSQGYDSCHIVWERSKGIVNILVWPSSHWHWLLEGVMTSLGCCVVCSDGCVGFLNSGLSPCIKGKEEVEKEVEDEERDKLSSLSCFCFILFSSSFVLLLSCSSSSSLSSLFLFVVIIFPLLLSVDEVIVEVEVEVEVEVVIVDGIFAIPVSVNEVEDDSCVGFTIVALLPSKIGEIPNITINPK